MRLYFCCFALGKILVWSRVQGNTKVQDQNTVEKLLQNKPPYRGQATNSYHFKPLHGLIQGIRTFIHKTLIVLDLIVLGLL